MTIGITYTGRDDKHQNYVNWIRGNDQIQVIKLSPSSKNNLAEIDGLVLSGGVDILPSFFNGEATYANMPSKFWKERDEFEFDILNQAIKKNMPVLGVCRGLQLINVFRKGTLTQDLNEKNDTHRDTDTDKKHNIKVNSNTLLHEIIQSPVGEVNSAHHQAIDKLGDNLVANSFADDGTIEGIEWKEKDGRPFLLAVQWHPERMDKVGIVNSPFSKNIRDRFIEEVKSHLK